MLYLLSNNKRIQKIFIKKGYKYSIKCKCITNISCFIKILNNINNEIIVIDWKNISFKSFFINFKNNEMFLNNLIFINYYQSSNLKCVNKIKSLFKHYKETFKIIN